MNESSVAVVTGGGRGIGRSISLRLARAGNGVVISYKADAAAAETGANIKVSGGL